jgi:hypothetical protein
MQDGKKTAEDREHASKYQMTLSDVQIRNKNLETEVAKLKTELGRSRNLNNNFLNMASPSSTSADVRDQNKSDSSSSESNSKMDAPNQQPAKDVCAFVLMGEECKRGTKCRFLHDVDPLSNKEEKIKELSQKAKKCMKNMVKKGTCNSECGYSHEKKPVSSRPTQIKVCFRELECEGSCRWRENCHFSHEIDEQMREDKELRETVKKEKTSKKSVCVNEYRERGSCRKKGRCEFRHDISEQERSSPKMKEEIQRKWEKMRGSTVDDRPKVQVKKEELISCVKMIQSILQQYDP